MFETVGAVQRDEGHLGLGPVYEHVILVTNGLVSGQFHRVPTVCAPGRATRAPVRRTRVPGIHVTGTSTSPRL